jgi:hypothetical protein
MKAFGFATRLALFVSFLAGSAYGATYYVATNGSDSNPGTIDQPFATINRGAAGLRPGDTLYVRGGTYFQTVYAPASGSPTAPVAISGYQSEIAVVDGAYTNPVSSWGNLFLVQGSNAVVRNLTVRRSNWIGLALTSPYDQAVNITSQSNMENGIIVTGSADYASVQNCQVYYNAKSNESFQAQRGQWSTGLSAARGPSYVTFRGNQVWNNWGEGLSTFECQHTLMESNVVYDNQLNIYLSDTKFATCRGNLVYCTPGNVCSNTSQAGIALADETFNPPSSDNTVVNNLLLGNAKNIYYWSGGTNAGLVNVTIAQNTLANSVVETNLKLLSGNHTNTVIENNIFLQEGSLPVAVVQGAQGITFTHNLWSKTPPVAAGGSGDVWGNPALAETGPTGPGQLTPDWFRLPSNSPAVAAGVVLGIAPTDFFGKSRGLLPDIGAIEHSLPPPGNLRVSSWP